MFGRSYNLFFSSGGNLLHYYMGYSSVIQNYYKTYLPKTKLNLGGVSAGALASSFLAYDINISETYSDWNKKLCDKLKLTPYYKIIDIFSLVTLPYFENKKPIHNLDIFTTRLKIPEFKKSLKLNVESEYFSACENIDKLFKSITSSCYLPVFGSNLFYTINNKYYIDGYFTFDPKKYKIDKFICYKNELTNIKLLDKYPSSDPNKNQHLYNLGKSFAIKDFLYEKIEINTN